MEQDKPMNSAPSHHGGNRREPSRAITGGVRQQLDESSSMLKVIMQCSSDVIISADMNGIITSLNASAERTLGYAAAEIVGQPISNYLPPDQFAEFTHNMGIVRHGNAVDPYRTRRRRKDGSAVDILTITITTATVCVDETDSRSHPGVQPGDYALLTVSDSGFGMDAKTKARIFEPFFTTKEPGKGTGLGLPMVYGIVKQSGGAIDVVSEPDRGATFRIYLPHSRQGVSAATSLDSLRTAPHGTETVLLVEDDEAVRALARYVLQACGYTVREAANGKEAIRLVEDFNGPLQLVVSDVVMPELGGLQLAERLRAMTPGLKVLFLSGYTDDSVIRHGVLPGEVCFLQKPFTPATLAQKVREVLDATA